MMPTGTAVVPLCRYIKSCNCTYRKKFYLCVTSLYDSIILVILIKFIYFPFEISLVGGISPIKTDSFRFIRYDDSVLVTLHVTV